jgi:hypothetical protein
MTMAFDTHEAAKELGRAGFTEIQVDALVNVARRATTLPDISNLATKSDIVVLKSDIAELRAATKSDIAELKSDIAELRAATKSDITVIKSDMAELKSELKAEIAAAKFQAIAILLPGMAAIMGIGTVLSHLLR